MTEQVTGIDLVQTQLRLAGGASLAELGLDQATHRSAPRRRRPGPGQRRAAAARRHRHAGHRHDHGLRAARRSGRPGRRLGLRRRDPQPPVRLAAGEGDRERARRRPGRRAPADGAGRGRAAGGRGGHQRRAARRPAGAAGGGRGRGDDHLRRRPPGRAGTARGHAGTARPQPTAPSPGFVGARIDAVDPLAVLDHGKAAAPDSTGPSTAGRPRTASSPRTAPSPWPAPLQGTVVAFLVGRRRPRPRRPAAPRHGGHEDGARRRGSRAAAGCCGGWPPRATPSPRATRWPSWSRSTWPCRRRPAARSVDLDRIRPDLGEVLDRHAVGLDPARPDMVARRRATAQRTARENVEDLCDPGTFVEYGAAGHRRAAPPAIGRRPDRPDAGRRPGVGLGAVNGDLFPEDRARCVILSYDYTVLAGTQGLQNHRKKDRLFELAERWRLPVVLLHRGRRRAAGRHRRGVRRRRPRLHGLPPVGPAERAGAARRHHLRAVLRRQRRAARLLRRRHRHRRLDHRHGRPGHDRGRRPRRLPARGGRADVGAGAERRGRRRGRGRGRRRRRGQALPLLLPGPAGDWEAADQRLLRSADPGEPSPRLRRAAGDRHDARRRLRAGAAAGLRSGHGHRPGPHRGTPDRRGGQRPDPPRRCHRRRRLGQGRPVHAAVRRLRPAAALPVRHARDDGGPGGREDRRWSATAAACSSPGPT